MLLATLRPENVQCMFALTDGRGSSVTRPRPAAPGLPAKRPEWMTISQCSVLRSSS